MSPDAASPRSSVSMSAREFIDTVVDPATFASWDTPPRQPDPDQAYRQTLQRAAQRAGTDESVLTGVGEIRGHRVAVVVSEFAFLAGSIGLAAAERITDAIDRATAERLPVLAATSSGGTRMQEGTPAFLGMVRVTGAVRRHKAAGLPYMVYLRHPTTGGVMASWGSLGHFTLAEPGALLGFLGPRVYKALYDEDFPAGVQTAENLDRRGLIDAVLTPEELPAGLARALRVLRRPDHVPSVPQPGTALLGIADIPTADPVAEDPRAASDGTWRRILASRNPERPDLRMLLDRGTQDWVPLSGTGEGERDPGLILALTRFGSRGCVVIGHRRPRPGQAAMGPAALRTARRGIAIAGDLALPLVTVIDTPGAELSPAAEEGGLAAEIARSLHDLLGVNTPSVAVLLGQGSGGGALALLPADRVIAAQNAWLSPLPPEGASSILYSTTERAPQTAHDQRVGADDLYRIGLVDHLIDERPDAALEADDFCARVARAIEFEIALAEELTADRVARRVARFNTLAW